METDATPNGVKYQALGLWRTEEGTFPAFSSINREVSDVPIPQLLHNGMNRAALHTMSQTIHLTSSRKGD